MTVALVLIVAAHGAGGVLTVRLSMGPLQVGPIVARGPMRAVVTRVCGEGFHARYRHEGQRVMLPLMVSAWMTVPVTVPLIWLITPSLTTGSCSSVCWINPSA